MLFDAEHTDKRVGKLPDPAPAFAVVIEEKARAFIEKFIRLYSVDFFCARKIPRANRAFTVYDLRVVKHSCFYPPPSLVNYF